MYSSETQTQKQIHPNANSFEYKFFRKTVAPQVPRPVPPPVPSLGPTSKIPRTASIDFSPEIPMMGNNLLMGTPVSLCGVTTHVSRIPLVTMTIHDVFFPPRRDGRAKWLLQIKGEVHLCQAVDPSIEISIMDYRAAMGIDLGDNAAP